MSDPNISLDDYEVPFRGIVEQSIIGIYILQDERFCYANETFAQMSGLRREQLVGARLKDVASPEQRVALISQYERTIRGDDSSEQFIVRRSLPSRPGCYELHGTRVIFHGRPAVVGVSVDITEQERQRNDLVRASRRLQELVASANSVRENERNRVARELHDVVGGMLTALKFDLSRLARGIGVVRERDAIDPLTGAATGPSFESLAATAARAVLLAQDAIEAVRGISEGLRPGALSHLGLCDTLSLDLNSFERRYGIATRFRPTGCAQDIDRDTEISIYRIFQEAMTNVARHSRATEVVVDLTWLRDRVVLEIADNGLGFERDSLAAEGHYGLPGMQERARELEGTLLLGASPSSGACVRLTVPMRHGGVPEEARP
ncbi:PAS domain-containing protein [Burkholderia sp. Ac-20384]|uniref:PAS domain-containing sensor histidine kinase n=1 Tax=Burkholderia sp. Ac-20384 TaxID=2703902 RepID=UPI001980BAAF|nr:PAS domain-containing sensor histidine kinase [Burkholderia sp. Ac-20384]MBN3827507.1 PAS domain-containing protein [Burkholderia sp. Ac-20384]